MSARYSKYIKLIHVLGDIIIIITSIGVIHAINHNTFSTSLFITASIFALLCWFTCTSLLDTYKIYRVTRRIKIIVTALKAILLYIILIEALLNISDFEGVTRKGLLFHYIALVITVVIWRIIVSTTLRVYRSKGYNLRNIVIIGHNKMSSELANFFEIHPEFGYRYLGYFHNQEFNGKKYIGRLEDLTTFVTQNQVDEVYCCAFELEKYEIAQLLKFSDDNVIRVKFLPEPSRISHYNLKIDFYDIFPVLIVRSLPLDDVINKFFKRSFDILFASIAIILILSWLLPILALLIRLNSKGPIIFKQMRSGRENKNFNCYKLRTMYLNTESNSKLVRKGDSRITPIGAFLRKTSLDELPQFFNVLFGQMSIVGPRPHMIRADEEYSILAEKYRVRHLVKPGITGLSQVRGYRGDTTYPYQVRGRVRLDIFYLENWSFYLDLKIIFYTIYNIIKGDKQAY